MIVTVKRLAIVGLAAVMLGCGGGGGDAGSPPPAPVPSVLPPAIVVQPEAVSTVEGAGATFSVTATGTSPLSYQWRREGVPIAGQTGSTYTIVPSLADDGAIFSVVVSNAAGSLASAGAVLRVAASAAPTILAHPLNASTTSSEASFDVFASPMAGLSVQWQGAAAGASDFVDLPGAMGMHLTVTPDRTLGHGARVRAVVRNGAGSVVSKPASLAYVQHLSTNCALPGARGWCWSSRSATGNQINAVAFSDQSSGWVVTALGEVLRTVDGGRSWDLQLIDRTRYFQNVVVQGPLTAWVSSGTDLYFTSDGGARWSLRATLPAPIIALVRTGTDDLWATLAGGVARSSDGGVSWTQQVAGVDQNLLSLASTDGITAWAVGVYGVAASTEDGGNTWTPRKILSADTQNFLLQVVCVDKLNLWVVSSDGSVLTSSDGGSTWVARADPQVQVRRIHAFDARRAIGVSSDARIYRTEDGAQTWQPLDDAGTSASLMAVSAAPTGTLWVVGDGGRILRSDDGGSSWLELTGAPAVQMTSVAASRQGLVAVGWDGTILRADTVEGRWTRVPSGSVRHLHSVAMQGASAWAVGDGGTVLYSSDSGRTWSTQSAGTPRILYSVSVADERNAWAVGAAGTVLSTKNAGSTWTLHSADTAAALNGVSAVSSSVVWAVGAGGTVLRTDDGGSTWRSQASGTKVELRAIVASTPDRAWVVGDDGVLLHTSDGGATWTRQSTASSLQLRSIAAAGAEVLFAAAGPPSNSFFGGGLLKSVDGGLSWSMQAPVAGNAVYGNRAMNGVVAIDGQRAVAVGQAGTLVHTTSGGQ